MRQTKSILIFWLGQKHRRKEKRKEEEEEEEEGEGEEDQNSGMESCLIWVFWIPRVLVWRIVAPLSRVLEEVTQTLHFC